MVHLRKLDLGHSKIFGDSRSLQTLMQNLFQLEDLNLSGCPDIGGQGGIASALYSTHSRLRVLNLKYCELVDEDLNGIGKLENTLEVLDLSHNDNLTNEGLMHCKDLVKLKKLNLRGCHGITDLSPLKDCLNLEKLDVSDCEGLTDNSFRVFSEDPNSVPHLCVLDLAFCYMLSEKAVAYLSKNNHLVYQLKELDVLGISHIVLSSARNNLYQLKGLQRLLGGSELTQHANELMRNLKNLEKLT